MRQRLGLFVGISIVLAPACSLTALDGFSGEPAVVVDGGGTESGGSLEGSANETGSSIDAAQDAGIHADAANVSPYAQAVRADTPVAYYRLDETATPFVKSAVGTGNDGVITGGLTLGVAGALAGDPNTAVTFNGSDARVTVASLFNFPGTAACSFEAWVKPTATGLQYNIMSKMDDANARGWLLYVDENTKVKFLRVDTGASVTANMEAQLALNAWSHVVFTYTGTTLNLYVNSVLKHSVSGAGSIGTVTNPFTIGQNQGFACCYFKGSIDEVAIYDKALSASRVAEHHRIGAGL